MNLSIVEKLALAEKKFQRAEKTLAKTKKQVQTLTASIPFLITRFNESIDHRNSLISYLIQWKLENHIKVDGEFEIIDKITEMKVDDKIVIKTEGDEFKS